MPKWVCLILLISMGGCMHSEDDKLVLQGHRGWRGSYPENSIPGFLAVVDLGVSTLELDVVVSADHQLVVSHEPFFNPEICTFPDGSQIGPLEAEQLNIYRMRADSVQHYICGTLHYERFPEQSKIPVHKPLLTEVIAAVREHCGEKNLAVPHFNIEAKSRVEWYGEYQPEPRDYARLLTEVIRSSGLTDQSTLQSFDLKMLQSLHSSFPEAKLICLNENAGKSMPHLVSALGFKPHGYSPYFKLIDAELVATCKREGIELSAWTVNEREDIGHMLDLGVRNIITDYPERVMEVLQERGLTVE